MTKDEAQQILIEEIIRMVELSALDKAEDIAQMAHLRQSRKSSGKPYIIHPKRVQLLAKSLGYGLDIQVIAILHDVIEDADNKEYYEDLIKQKFGKDIYSTIKLLSHDKNAPYEIYLKKLAQSKFEITRRAFKVKMLDMYDNLTDAPTEKQKTKYKEAIQMLIDNNLAQDVPAQILKLVGIEQLTEAPKDSPKDEPEPKDSPEPKDTSEPKADIPDDKGGDSEPSNKGEKDMPPETGDELPGLGSDKPGGEDMGGDIFGGDEEPSAPGEGDDEGASDAENSIVKFNDKLKQSKVIDKQKDVPEPGFNFSNDNEFYRKNYISISDNGSALIGVPSTVQNNADMDFIKKAVIPKIIKVAYEAIKNGKKVVLLGDYGLPYYDGKYSNTVSGLIANVLNDKFKNTIEFDTWNPQDYYGFVSNIWLWKELKQRTEAENMSIKAALYLFLLATERDKKIANKLKTDNVLEVLSQWGLSQNDVELEEKKDEILRVIFPDKYNSPETEASYIIKTYLQLLRVNMLKKVIQYEKEGKAVIVPTDINTAWVLNKSFKDLSGIQKSAEEEKEAEKSAEESPKDEKEPQGEKTPSDKEVPEKEPTEKTPDKEPEETPEKEPTDKQEK